jgi:hypothetical protein
VPDTEEVRHCARCDAWTWFTRPAGGPPLCIACGTPLAGGEPAGRLPPLRALASLLGLAALAALLLLALYLAKG